MTRLVYIARFFTAVPAVPPLTTSTFTVMTVIAIVVIVIDPSHAAGALTPILLLQLFGSASGFDVHARRGHYDLLLTRGISRRRIVLAHWAASALPGAISWLIVASVSEVAAAGREPSLFTAGSACALILVSTIPWAITTRLPRFSGAIGWLLILATVAVVATPPSAIRIHGSVNTWDSWVTAALAALVYPPLLVGSGLEGRDALVMLPGLTVSLLTLAFAVWSIDRRDIPLEAAQ
ncbi:MAG TPA: hypothetical protein VM846_10400 [Vicinamibacterales bacterium]|nr:hypothetical protein [Vicinamibacterales bacterium]